MKICWDNLDKIKLTKNGNFKIGKNVYYEHECCLNCKNPYLGTSEKIYCSSKCASQSIKYRQNLSISGRGKGRSIETRNRISDANKGNGSHFWKGGYHSNNIPVYDLYIERLEIYEQCRRQPDDPNILEVKCTYCSKWFVPNSDSVRHRINRGIKGNDGSRFYCSTSCKQECPVYGQQKYYKGQQGYSSREVQPQVRQMTFERDSWVCIRCGCVEHLHCHHLDPVANNPIESADVDNCITLCKKCHKRAHKERGCTTIELRKCISGTKS